MSIDQRAVRVLMSAHLVMLEADVDDAPSEDDRQVGGEEPACDTPRCMAKIAQEDEWRRETGYCCKQRQIDMRNAVPVKRAIKHPLVDGESQEPDPDENTGSEQ